MESLTEFEQAVDMHDKFRRKQAVSPTRPVLHPEQRHDGDGV